VLEAFRKGFVAAVPAQPNVRLLRDDADSRYREAR
jgi:hypothetical protein